MSSSHTYSATDSYTVVDVRKVMDKLHADLRQIAQMTGCWTEAYADKVMADIMRFAESDYLDEVKVHLFGADGKTLKAYHYDVQRNVSGLAGVRSGGNLWSGAATRMNVLIEYSSKWRDLDESAKTKFRNSLGLSWSSATDDYSVAHLAVSDQRTYASNGFGLQKKVYGSSRPMPSRSPLIFRTNHTTRKQ